MKMTTSIRCSDELWGFIFCPVVFLSHFLDFLQHRLKWYRALLCFAAGFSIIAISSVSWEFAPIVAFPLYHYGFWKIAKLSGMLLFLSKWDVFFFLPVSVVMCSGLGWVLVLWLGLSHSPVSFCTLNSVGVTAAGWCHLLGPGDRAGKGWQAVVSEIHSSLLRGRAVKDVIHMEGWL